MSAINITRKHHYPVDELRSKIDKIGKVIEKNFKVRSEWQNDRHLHFHRKGIKGNIEIDENIFQLNVNLSIMYRMMKAEIEKQIGSVVDEYFGKCQD